MSADAEPRQVHNRAKLSVEDVRWVRANLRVPVKVAAAKLGVHPGTIKSIRSGKSWYWIV